MISKILVAAVDVIETVAPYAIALASILGLVAVVIWVFHRWNREPPI